MRKLLKVGFSPTNMTEGPGTTRAYDMKEVAAYLDSGKVLVASPGVVFDELVDQSRRNKPIGSQHIFTDGIWAWPQVLPYYILSYKLPLPLKFVEHVSTKQIVGPVNFEGIFLDSD